ncbi:MAG: hypothetical protein IPL61_22945 [Myxococcales bacterium]|nr:hypothetical protein [Myxococcales bacterium]
MILPTTPTVEEGARALTAGGLEIEGLTDLGCGFTGVVVAQVVAKRPHPQSTKLTLVDVIVAPDGPATQVVCGAPNVPEPGRKVLWAPPGATLPGGMTLATKAVKGVDSPGMLCAEDELGLGDDHDGIIVLAADDATPLGAPAQQALGVDDWLLDVNVPANRGDCLGHEGLARELAALVGGRLRVRDLSASWPPWPATRAADLIELAIDDAGRAAVRGADRRRRDRRAVAASVRGPAARGRRAPDLEPGRRHQLRAVRAGPAAARVRLAPAGGAAAHRRAARGGRRAADHARRQRPRARAGRSGDHRRLGAGGPGRRDGRAHHRGHGRHLAHLARERQLRSEGDPPHRAPPEPAVGGVAAVRARRRSGAGWPRGGAGRGAPGAARRRPHRGRRGRSRSSSAAAPAGGAAPGPAQAPDRHRPVDGGVRGRWRGSAAARSPTATVAGW